MRVSTLSTVFNAQLLTLATKNDNACLVTLQTVEAAIVAERSRASTFVVDSSRAIRVDGFELESRQGMADK